MSVFTRLFTPDENTARLPIHPMYAAMLLLDRGHITAAQFMEMFDLQASDLAPGSTLQRILAMSAEVPAQYHRDFGRDVWAILLLVEWNEEDTLGLRDEEALFAKLGQIRDGYIGLG